MATLVLGAVGTAIGGAFGGAILGFSGAAIGGFIGSTVGSVVDSWIVSSLAPAQKIEGQRLESLRITSATEGAILPRGWDSWLHGRQMTPTGRSASASRSSPSCRRRGSLPYGWGSILQTRTRSHPTPSPVGCSTP